MNAYFEYTPEVEAALAKKSPVVALESTLITHGFPYPHNLEIARASEEICRRQQVTPATLAIINGQIKIGVSAQELEVLATQKDSIKASRLDLGYAISQKKTAGLTVASTMFVAHRVGIKIFATGGIGGVHRGDDMDISADLIELARTPVAVVCAGAKSILNLAKTLEFLETYSVSVVGYQTDVLPAFYTARTPYSLSLVVRDIAELISLLTTQWELGLSAGTLIVNPVPLADEVPNEVIEPIIEQAILAAKAKNIYGKALTPFLLNAIVQQTEGRSLRANLSLIKNNVELGAKMATLLYNRSI